MEQFCIACKNKNADTCEGCGKWHKNFIPKETIKDYFELVHLSSSETAYVFNNTNQDLKPTHVVKISGTYYCPYCGCTAFHIQKPKTLETIGYCCTCDGAMAELEYEKAAKDLEDEYHQKKLELQSKYQDRLKFCSKKLFDIKQETERKSFEFFKHMYTHFNTETKDDINKIIN